MKIHIGTDKIEQTQDVQYKDIPLAFIDTFDSNYKVHFNIKKEVYLVALCKLVAFWCSLFFIYNFVDLLFYLLDNHSKSGFILTFAFRTTLSLVIYYLATTGDNFFSHKISKQVRNTLREEIYNKVEKLSLNYTEAVNTGSLLVMNSSSIVNIIEDKKGQDIKVYDMRGKSPFFDYSILCTGSSSRNIEAIATDIKKSLENVKNVEGLEECNWVLIDAGDIIVSVFSKDAREYYQLDAFYSGVSGNQTEEEID